MAVFQRQCAITIYSVWLVAWCRWLSKTKCNWIYYMVYWLRGWLGKGKVQQLSIFWCAGCMAGLEKQCATTTWGWLHGWFRKAKRNWNYMGPVAWLVYYGYVWVTWLDEAGADVHRGLHNTHEATPTLAEAKCGIARFLLVPLRKLSKAKKKTKKNENG